jgi:hypothetical protein
VTGADARALDSQLWKRSQKMPRQQLSLLLQSSRSKRYEQDFDWGDFLSLDEGAFIGDEMTFWHALSFTVATCHDAP